MKRLIPILFTLLFSFSQTFADEGDTFNRREEASLPDSSSEEVSRSPKKGWGDFAVTEEEAPSSDNPWRTALLWLPNRIVDFVDIFRVDVGVGPAVGGVVRVTRYGQAGIRMFKPAMVRVGDFGRQEPYMIERSNEFGVGPAYVKSKDRTVCDAEVGLGLDVFLVGGYGGICFDEVVDFIGGVFTADPKKDDWR